MSYAARIMIMIPCTSLLPSKDCSLEMSWEDVIQEMGQAVVGPSGKLGGPKLGGATAVVLKARTSESP